jgi:hypothetical protein
MPEQCRRRAPRVVSALVWLERPRDTFCAWDVLVPTFIVIVTVIVTVVIVIIIVIVVGMIIIVRYVPDSSVRLE